MDPETRFQTLHDLLRWRAIEHPERLLYTFLHDGEEESAQLTYGELDARARAVAVRLQAQCAPGDRILLLYQPGIDYIVGFFACLYAGMIAVPAYPPDPARAQRTLPRLLAIIKNAGIGLVLTTAPILRLSRTFFAQVPALGQLTWLETDGVDVASADAWRAPGTDGTALAFLQYTSGSTAAPKGVMLSHANLMANLAHIKTMMAFSTSSKMISWLPPYHDMGLIGTVLEPAYSGSTSVLMPPVAFLRRPMRWLRAISTYRGTVAGGPNFGFDLCVRKFDPAQETIPLDLSSLSVLFNGAEPVRAETLARFTATFSPYGFQARMHYPCYGLAESTLITTGVRIADEPTTLRVDKAALQAHRVVPAAADDDTTMTLVSSGHAIPNLDLRIVDPQTMAPLPENAVGEIWIRGESVGQGYWGAEAATAAAFDAVPQGETGDPYFRTGDLGFMRHGHLFVTGRIKDLIKLFGRNHYPQDLELTMERAHATLRPGCGAAFSVDMGGRERLVLVQEMVPPPDEAPEAIIESIRRAVAAEHEVRPYDVVLIEPRTIYKTSSGKIQRSATRQAYLDGRLSALASALDEHDDDTDESGSSMLLEMLTPIPEAMRKQVLTSYLRHQVAMLLGIEATTIDPEQPLGNYGINSVKAVELSELLQAGAGRLMPTTLAYDYPTLDAIVDYLLEDVLGLVVKAEEAPAPAATNEDDLADLADLSEEEALRSLLEALDDSE